MNALATMHDASVQMIDTSIVRVHPHGACITRNRRQAMGRSRGGLTSKIHAVVDSNGLPVQLALTAGEAHDNRLAGKLLSRLKSGTMLLADRGYDADWIRALAAKRGVWANIPPRCNRNNPICFSPYLYRARNSIERFFNKIKQCRRVATRYDKLAANYRIRPACINKVVAGTLMSRRPKCDPDCSYADMREFRRRAASSSPRRRRARLAARPRAIRAAAHPEGARRLALRSGRTAPPCARRNARGRSPRDRWR
jgi:transposase